MAIHTTRLPIRTYDGASMHDMTAEINRYIAATGFERGLCVLATRYDDCALSLAEDIEEHADDFIRLARDFLRPRAARSHTPSDRLDSSAAAHAVPATLSHELTLPVAGGRLATGSWESVIMLESRGPRDRHVDVSLIGR